MKPTFSIVGPCFITRKIAYKKQYFEQKEMSTEKTYKDCVELCLQKTNCEIWTFYKVIKKNIGKRDTDNRSNKKFCELRNITSKLDKNYDLEEITQNWDPSQLPGLHIDDYDYMISGHMHSCRRMYYTLIFFIRITFLAESLMLILWSLRSESRDSYFVRIINNY